MDSKEIEALKEQLRKEMADTAAEVFDQKSKDLRWSSFDIPKHTHNGKDAPRINQGDIVPQKRASGSIRMRQSTRYTFNLTFNPTMVMFYGNVVYYGTPYDPSTITIRAFTFGSAFLGDSYYFQPQTSTSVSTGGTTFNVVQSGAQLLTSESGLANFVATDTEGHLISVTNALGSIVARATIPNLSTVASSSYIKTDKGYGPGFLYLDVDLDDGWEINGNFVVT